MNVATYHEIEPRTGFMQSTGNYPYSFDAAKKEQFLEVYRSNGLSFYKTCKQLSLRHETVNHHYAEDQAFKEAFDLCEKEYADELQAVSRNNALVPRMVIERIFQLKSLYPGKYSDAQKSNADGKVVINVSGDLLIDAKKRAESLQGKIDQEIVDTTAKIESTSQKVQNNASIPPTQ